MSALNVGIIGCGNISTAYLDLAPRFVGYTIVACADINKALADAQAERFKCRAMGVEELLADESIDLVVNLTIPTAHYEVSKSILSAGKHVYSEKPYVLSVDEGKQLKMLATKNNKRIGSAPDTFLGGSHQRARECIDTDMIGRIVGGSCFFQSHGMESWHPAPEFFYQMGGGPVLDMGAYYLSNLVQLIGPIKQVVAMGCKPFAQRTLTTQARADEVIPVDVQTTVHSIIEFEQGAQITFGASWDVWASEHQQIELHGTKQSMYVPDPNNFGGIVRVVNNAGEQAFEPMTTLSALNYTDANDNLVANYRGIGLADMAVAISENRDHRCNGDLALHVVDAMVSILASAESGRVEILTTTCAQPAALPDSLASALVVL